MPKDKRWGLLANYWDRSRLIGELVKADDEAYPHRTYSHIKAGDEDVPFAHAVTMMKEFLTKRIAALNNLIGSLQ